MTMTQPIRTSVAGPTGVRRLFAAPAPDLASHLAAFGPMPAAFDEGHLIAELDDSGLTGRGGAAFPTWRKLIAAAESVPSKRGPAVVIANGAEGEPLSRKDATLLRSAPHLVLDGLLLAAATIRAGDVVLYAPASSFEPVARAIAERPDAGRVRLVAARDTFLSGEASAVVSAVGGGPAIPRDHPARLTDAGLRGAPTLVQNVETLAHVALLARFGATWFRQAGTPDDPGTRLVSLSGDLPVPAVFEVPGGVPLADALGAAGASVDGLRAVLVGGYHGAWVPASALSTRLSMQELAPFGATPGAGILMALGTHRCGLDAAAEIAAYLAGQSARQCGPCANGLPRLADVLRRLAARDRAEWLPGEVDRLARLVAGRGSCHHPDGTSRMVLSALTVFADDVREHLAGRCVVTS
ncbi:NADH dehydrogenase subunit F [Frondihabitans sp. PhB188]|uniref:NADH-ubiquinone oxidoreductase-F iron-sulfur binding region domain-containing protein n=1 Tax=Frondihabitans sp. PhB188 TaxID=2485200 RepID=UPI000F4687C8|nr:NADH-ubiquinone oxidoreductase-F iron-sulfur binding region domain-containing protein [Frondihabitans sp. PhB188]ROQ39853.1 NADH dehydrogenase subunit F [Frondihabitans sp. PhB188]